MKKSGMRKRSRFFLCIPDFLALLKLLNLWNFEKKDFAVPTKLRTFAAKFTYII